MSVRVMSLVWDAFPASGSDLLAMLALADWCDDQGGSLYPSVKSVAEKIRVSESQARRILRKFEADGYLAVVGNHFGGAPGTSRKYQLNVLAIRKLALAREEKRLANTGSADDTRGTPEENGEGDGSDGLPANSSSEGEEKVPENASTGGMDATPGMDATRPKNEGDGLHGCARRVAPMRETGGMGATQTIKEPSKNHQLNTDAPADADAALSGGQEGKGNPDQGGKAPADDQEAGKPKTKAKGSKAKAKDDAAFDPLAELLALGVGEQEARDWLTVRKNRRLPLTKTALSGVQSQAAKAGFSMHDAVKLCCVKSWGGFNAAWLSDEDLLPGMRARAGKQGAAKGFDPADESTWGINAKGQFNAGLYLEHKRQAYFAMQDECNAQAQYAASDVIDVQATEVVL